MCDCKDCDCRSSDSGFIFGLVIGAVIGAAVAVLIYKNNQSEVITNFKQKLEKYFKKFTQFTESEPAAPKTVKLKTKVTPAKIPVVIPSKLIAKTTSPKVISAKPRKFVKPKD
jgi:Na+/glutamate symporter